MNFKKFLSETGNDDINEVHKYFRNFRYQAAITGSASARTTGSFFDIIDEDDVKLNSRVRTLFLFPKIADPQTWTNPMSTAFWGNLNSLYLMRDDSQGPESFLFEDFTKIPNVVELGIGGSTIKSWKGCSKLTRTQHLLITDEYCRFRGGLLEILKMPSLRELEIERFPRAGEKDENGEEYEDDDDNAKGYAALKIIAKYVESGKNVPECQQELIEEGFQEYAKL